MKRLLLVQTKKLPLLVAVLILFVLPLTTSCASTGQEGGKASNDGSMVSPTSANDEGAEDSDEKEASSTSKDKGTSPGSKTGKQVVSENVKGKQTNSPVSRGTSTGGASPTSKDELELDPPKVSNPSADPPQSNPPPRVENRAPLFDETQDPSEVYDPSTAG